MPPYLIKKSNISLSDIKEAVKIHRQEISQGFLSSLGDRALELLFTFALKNNYGVFFVVKDTKKNKICGFLLGALNTGKFYKDFLIRKSFKAIFILAPKLLSFEKIRKVLETLLYPSKNEMQSLPNAELLDIAIKKECQGTGLAQDMFKEFNNYLLELNINEFKITTGESLIRAQRFYESLGAKKVNSINIHEGQKTFVYTYEIAGKKTL